MATSEQRETRSSEPQIGTAYARLQADALNGGGSHGDVFLPEGDQYDRGLVRERNSGPGGDSWGISAGASGKECPRCKGAGWLRQGRFIPGHPQYVSRVECRCLLEKRRQKRKERMLALCVAFGFRRELAPFKPQLPGVQEAFKATRRMIDLIGRKAAERLAPVKREGEQKEQPTSRRWLLLIGPSGRGKTHLAMAVGNAGLDADVVTLFATVPDLLDHLRKAFSPTSETAYDELFEQFRSAELLILDDLGAETSSKWASEKLFQLLNHRYNMGLFTVITMNGRAWDHLDRRLQSRLSDRSLVEVVYLDQAQDYRALVVST